LNAVFNLARLGGLLFIPPNFSAHMTTDHSHSLVHPISRRSFVAASLAGLGTATTTRPLHAEDDQSPATPTKKLIGWGSDVAYPAKVQGTIRQVEELPLDGIVLSNFSGKKAGKEFTFDWECFGRQKFDRDDLAPMIDILANIRFKRFTHNFLRFTVQPGNFDWFDDFSGPLHNARMWAGVAQEVGAKGWKFDVEDYKERLFVYKKQKHANTKSFDEYAAQIRLRGRQMMEAIQSANPKIVLLLSLAHSYVNRTPNAKQKLAELPSYGLLPAFVNGLVEAAGPGVRIIDGQEQAYGYMTTEDYFRGYHDIKQRALELVPPGLHKKYRDKMEVGVAIFANYQLAAYRTTPTYWPSHYMTPETRLRLFEQNIYHALKTTDEYAWLYSEHMGWWESGHQVPTPAGALQAIHKARDKFAANKALGFNLDNAIAEARSKMKAATRGKE